MSKERDSIITVESIVSQLREHGIEVVEFSFKR